MRNHEGEQGQIPAMNLPASGNCRFIKGCERAFRPFPRLSTGLPRATAHGRKASDDERLRVPIRTIR